MSTPTKTALNTTVIEPLVVITGTHAVHPNVPQNVSVYEAECRTCGPLAPIVQYPTAAHANMLQKRHLAEHLTALAAEIASANR